VHRDVPVLQQQQEELIFLSVNRTPARLFQYFALKPVLHSALHCLASAVLRLALRTAGKKYTALLVGLQTKKLFKELNFLFIITFVMF